MITPYQNRYIDPFSDVSSQAVNNRLRGIFTKSKACLYGLMLSTSNLDITVSKGVALKDWVVLDFPDDMTFTVNNTGTFYVVIKYVYQVVKPAPQAEVGYISTDEYTANPDLYVIIATITSDGSTITSISYDDRDINPISELVQQYFTYKIASDLNMNNYHIINLADPVNETDGVNKRSLNAIIGEVKMDEQDSPDYLPQKFSNGGNTSVSVDETDPNNKKLLVNALDEYVKVESADSGKSFI